MRYFGESRDYPAIHSKKADTMLYAYLSEINYTLLEVIMANGDMYCRPFRSFVYVYKLLVF